MYGDGNIINIGYKCVQIVIKYTGKTDVVIKISFVIRSMKCKFKLTEYGSSMSYELSSFFCL